MKKKNDNILTVLNTFVSFLLLIKNEVDKYFLLSEKVAKDLDRPLNKYTILLQSILKGKASEVYFALKQEQTSDYLTDKEPILKAYELVPETYRQKIRNFKKEADKTQVEFARERKSTSQMAYE